MTAQETLIWALVDAELRRLGFERRENGYSSVKAVKLSPMAPHQPGIQS